VSIIGQLKEINPEDSKNTTSSNQVIPVSSLSHSVLQNEIVEEDETQADTSMSPPPQPKPKESAQQIEDTTNSKLYTWRINLSKTEKYWSQWFKGMSSKFLSTTIPKLLLLAGVDRLDRELTIGQMQGKFQMQVLGQCGHSVHEDSPMHVADAISNFMLRNKFTKQIDSTETKTD
jgi:protein phosphatase methylesterase 1